MLSLLKRYQEPVVVILLLVYPLAKFLRTGHRPSTPNVIERSILGMSSPIQRGLDATIDFVVDGVKSYVALVGVREANVALKQENSKLKFQQRQLKELIAENHRLHLLLDYADRTVEQEILARVVGINPVGNALSIRINRGSNDGLKMPMPVVTAEGVVGRVERVLSGWADVRLLTDRNSRVAVVTQRGRVRGTAAGIGSNKRLSLQYVETFEDVVAGDVVVTSGIDGIFPRGLVVGTISRVEKSPSGMFLDATVEPAVALEYLEEVLVLPATGAGQEEGAIP